MAAKAKEEKPAKQEADGEAAEEPATEKKEKKDKKVRAGAEKMCLNNLELTRIFFFPYLVGKEV